MTHVIDILEIKRKSHEELLKYATEARDFFSKMPPSEGATEYANLIRKTEEKIQHHTQIIVEINEAIEILKTK